MLSTDMLKFQFMMEHFPILTVAAIRRLDTTVGAMRQFIDDEKYYIDEDEHGIVFKECYKISVR